MIDIDKFVEWAEYCDELVPSGDDQNKTKEKRICFDGVFDNATSLWDAIFRVCEIGRATPIWLGTRLTLVIDKPMQNAVQMFTIGNIGIDSFEEIFLSQQDRVSKIELEINDKDNNYEKTTFTVHDATMNQKANKITFPLIGCTCVPQAWWHGMYRLACNKYITRMIKFKADIDALVCTIGDKILVQHDIPQWGYGVE